MAQQQHYQQQQQQQQEPDINQLWATITELSNQFNKARSASVSLIEQTSSLRSQAVHSQSGFVLRRFNTHIPVQDYETALEKMNGSLAAENASLVNDNKALNGLIREYEQTLDTVMSNFRNRAGDVQDSELKLIRTYESKLLEKEEENSRLELEDGIAFSEAIAKLSGLLRAVLKCQVGEDDSSWQDGNGVGEEDKAMEREVELVRLQCENEHLRRLAAASSSRV